MRIGLVGMLLAALLAGCSAPTPDRVPTTASPRPDASHDPYSLPAQFTSKVKGSALALSPNSDDFGAYRQHTVTYKADGVTVSGVLNIPKGNGPFPAVVLNHGHIEPAVYVTGQGMNRELDYLAREGFVVLHTDYRGHAQSDPAGDLEHELRLGYVKDSIAAVKVLRRLPQVDADRVAMAGRSMGGGVTFGALVVEPDIVDAAVVWASVSTRFVDNYRQWTEPNRPGTASAVVRRWGTYEDNPEPWRELSPQYYVGRIDAAVMMHHGTLDESCPYAWALDTKRALERAGVDLTFHSYAGEGHTFYPQWETSMRRTVDFLRENA
jgi:dipeptidyl aminopeptidase/acylaminoacyl peptidase